jgi:hypothetical protein
VSASIGRADMMVRSGSGPRRSAVLQHGIATDIYVSAHVSSACVSQSLPDPSSSHHVP